MEKKYKDFTDKALARKGKSRETGEDERSEIVLELTRRFHLYVEEIKEQFPDDDDYGTPEDLNTRENVSISSNFSLQGV